MRVEIQSPEAEQWFTLVCEAMVGRDEAEERCKELTRTEILAQENKWRRRIPFVKSLPSDTPLSDALKHLSHWDSYWIDIQLYRDRKKRLERIFYALSDIINNRIRAVTLTDDELSLIRRYANASTNSK